MGRMLGSFADDQELDRPDLNKCPDCNCFFQSQECPLCGKICPENMRAGNRAPVKQKKNRSSSYSGRVTFVQWYHSWWFIAIMMLFFPIVGIVLLITSPHKTWKKAVFIALAVVYMALSTIGISNIISGVVNMWDAPVDQSLTREEYVSKCEPVTVEQICRSSDGYDDKFVYVNVKIVKKVTYRDDFYNEKDYICYLCEEENGSEYKLILRDCLIEDQQRFIVGDVITVYGEGAGEGHAYDSEYNEWTAPCLNMAYVDINTD